MNIVVCVKQVPNTKEVRINPETRNIIREGVPSIMNPYDLGAIEQALRIRESVAGSVTVLSMGPMQALEVLQEALDMGADRAILLCDRLFAGSDTLATGYVLSTAIQMLNADLVLCGSEAIDGCTGQVGPIISENLGWPHFTYVNNISVEGTNALVSREVKEGFEKYKCELPVVACLLKGINVPRKPNACEKKPEILTCEDIHADKDKLGFDGSPTRVAHISTSGRSMSSFVYVDGSLPTRERIKLLMNGGIIPKEISFMRGSAQTLAKIILNEETFAGHLEN